MQKTRTVTFVRHLEQTVHAADPPLKPVTGPLPRYKCDRILCSPYLRCRETARLLVPLAGDDVPITIVRHLAEYQGGKDARRRFRLEPGTIVYGPVPGPDEEWYNFECRMTTLLKVITSASAQWGDLLIVTHGIVVNYMHEQMCGTVSPYKRGRHVPFGRGFTVKV